MTHLIRATSRAVLDAGIHEISDMDRSSGNCSSEPSRGNCSREHSSGNCSRELSRGNCSSEQSSSPFDAASRLVAPLSARRSSCASRPEIQSDSYIHLRGQDCYSYCCSGYIGSKRCILNCFLMIYKLNIHFYDYCVSI